MKNEIASARGQAIQIYVAAAFLRQHAPGPWKMTMPAASYMLARGYNPAITDRAYGTRAAALAGVECAES